jgi:hypothetical protein
VKSHPPPAFAGAIHLVLFGSNEKLDTVENKNKDKTKDIFDINLNIFPPLYCC